MRPSDQVTAIIGGGLGGLAAACTLSARGHRVVLFDQNAWWGGKAAVLESDGFRFDMGPTILTLPEVLRRIFAEARQDINAYLDLIPLDPQWRCFFSDQSTLDLHRDRTEMAAALDRFSPSSGDGYARFLDFSKRLHEMTKRYFFWRSIGSLGELLTLRACLTSSLLSDLLALKPGCSVAGAIRRHVADARVAQMLDHFTQYVGSAPDASPAVLCGIAQMQTGEGVWYPRGGIGTVPRALTRLAETLGVEFRNETIIQRIHLCSSGRVHAVETTEGDQIEVTSVVCNSDTVRTHQELLPSAVSRRFMNRRQYEPACSGIVLYLGLDHGYDHLLHHNFVFSRDPHAEFDWIYRRGEPAPDPTCYVCAPARTEPGVAPPGGEALYVLVHTPYLRAHHDWSAMLPAYRRVILDKLQQTAGLTDLESRIRFEACLTPYDIQERYRAWKGAIYGLASHGLWTGAFKPANRAQEVPGLYFAGGSAHPGPGMPMALMSGWIAADCLDRDQGAMARPAMAGG